MTEEKRGRGAPLGNRNAAKERVFHRELRRRLADDPQIIMDVAERLIIAARKGEPWAIKEFRDTLDGKPAQAVSVANEDGSPLLTGITVSLVKAADGT
jgi:hypothetical protein